MHKEFDVIVVGAGLVGCLQALALADKGLKILLLEKQRLTREFNEQDKRGFALSYASVQMLKKLGCFKDLEPTATPIQEVRVSEEGTQSHLHLDGSHMGGKVMGYLVEAARLRFVLQSHVFENENIHLMHGIAFENIEQDDHFVYVKGKELDLKAKLLIAADGKKSFVREHLNFATRNVDYGQSAIVGTLVHNEVPHENIACEHFLEKGLLALLPLQGNRSSFVWALPSFVADEKMRQDEAQINKDLFMTFPYLGQFTFESQPHLYPLSAKLVKKQRKGRVLLIGDAAHSIHPLAGQGLNLGMMDVIRLTPRLCKSYHLGLDIGSSAYLERFTRLRRLEVEKMFLTTDLLQKMFAKDWFVLKKARHFGMRVLNKMTPVKKLMMREAMGEENPFLKFFLS